MLKYLLNQYFKTGLGEILKNQMKNEHQKEFIDRRLYYKNGQLNLNL